MKLRPLFASVLISLAVGCGGSSDRPDASDTPLDAARADARTAADGSVDAGEPDAAGSDAGERDASAADALPGDALPVDATTGLDAAPPADGGGIGASCTEDVQCESALCGPRGRCAAFEADVIDPLTPVSTIHAAVEGSTTTIVAYTQTGGRNPVWFARRTATGWDRQDTGLRGWVLDLGVAPTRIAVCPAVAPAVPFVATETPSGWTTEPITGESCSSYTSARFIGGPLYLASTVGGAVRVVEAAPGAAPVVTTADTPPAGSFTDDIPRLAADESGAPALIHVSDIPESPGSTARRATIRLARLENQTWTSTSVAGGAFERASCLAFGGGRTFIGTQTEAIGFTIVEPDGSAQLFTPRGHQAGTGSFCGARGDGIWATAASDPSRLRLYWPGPTELRSGTVRSQPERYGCFVGAHQEMLGAPGDEVRWVTLTAPRSRHTGEECVATLITVRD